MRRAELYRKVTEYFQKAMPGVQTELHYDTPFGLLVAVMLSAQCTDRRVNTVTPALLHDYPNAEAMSQATPETIREYIKSVSYPNSKARHLVGMAAMLQREYGGEVPSTLQELTRLPGVGRKTANVVLSVIFKQPAMAVDTHVFRVSHRIGLVPPSCTTPLSVERVLTRHFAPGVLRDAHHWLILHGRHVCTALSPDCPHCGLNDICQGKLAWFGKNGITLQKQENRHKRTVNTHQL
ncbi:MAG TPA: endonuclease III [Prevotellaceae bacterium]|nr:endonuclease III [Prevotellaceae bacterium]